MQLLTSEDLGDAIKRIVRGRRISCAVAFWGIGSDATIVEIKEREVRLICNLQTGGTNPDAIRALMAAGADIRQNDRLHAKVYIGDEEAIVASANASINGLGFEGTAAAYWIEAGVIVPAVEAIGWFDALWANSRRIDELDWIQARPRFAYHKTPGLNLTEEDFPLVAWSGDVDWTFDHNKIRQEVGADYDSYASLLDMAIEVEVPKIGRYSKVGSGSCGGTSEVMVTPTVIHLHGGFARAGALSDRESG